MMIDEQQQNTYAFGNVVAAYYGIRLQAPSVAEHHRIHSQRLFNTGLQVW